MMASFPPGSGIYRKKRSTDFECQKTPVRLDRFDLGMQKAISTIDGGKMNSAIVIVVDNDGVLTFGFRVKDGKNGSLPEIMSGLETVKRLIGKFTIQGLEEFSGEFTE